MSMLSFQSPKNSLCASYQSIVLMRFWLRTCRMNRVWAMRDIVSLTFMVPFGVVMRHALSAARNISTDILFKLRQTNLPHSVVNRCHTRLNIAYVVYSTIMRLGLRDVRMRRQRMKYWWTGILCVGNPCERFLLTRGLRT